MTAATTSAEEDYQRYRPAVLRFLAARYPRLDEEVREEVCQDAFVALFHAKGYGTQIDSAEGYLIRCARNGANRCLSSADARRRVSLEPAEYEAIPDYSASPEERALSIDESR
jgi:DNA-directed RNA polymerase specialized sigma24 family protein